MLTDEQKRLKALAEELIAADEQVELTQAKLPDDAREAMNAIGRSHQAALEFERVVTPATILALLAEIESLRGASASEQEPQQEQDWDGAFNRLWDSIQRAYKSGNEAPEYLHGLTYRYCTGERTSELHAAMMALGGADWQRERAPRES